MGMTNTKDLNRIKIGDEWYVKEALVASTVGPDPDVLPDIVWVKTALIENDEYVFEATVLTDEDFMGYDMLSVAYTDKRVSREAQREDDWDNDAFLKGLLDENRESWEQVSGLSSNTKKDLLWFLRQLSFQGWL
jgi:hypothetical protein